MDTPLPLGVGAVQGIVQLGEVTVTVRVQPFKVAVMVAFVPTGIPLTVLPLTVPALLLKVPFVVIDTL